MQLKSIITVFAIVAAGSLYGCQNEKFIDSPDGYKYKFVKEGTGETPKDGIVCYYNIVYKTEKDSVLFETTAATPVPIPCNIGEWSSMGPLYKALQIIKEGDSIIVKIPTKKLFDESFRAQVPPMLDTAGEITFYIGASKYLSHEEMQAEMMKAGEEQLAKDKETIDSYLQQKQITAQSTESGLRYVINAEGAGSNPTAGQQVTVHYTGTLLDGTKFDSSLDRNEPIEFVLGQGQVIPGWDEGIALLKAGGKGTLYIPSSLAYGERGAGGVIPPNAVLMFEVELIKIE
jgi:FKBP-type peptidyl-prolyl cis-trans isomerase FkpA